MTLASGVPSWATPTTGTVTSVSGTGTVSGISLSGTVTSSGSLTLGGTLDLSSPPIIGGTTPNTITGTTITANTKFVSSYFDAAGSGGGSLRTSGGTAVLQWGGGGGVNLTLDGAFNMNPANYSISIAPTGSGTLTVNPATAGTINNMSIGLTTAAAGYFTTLSLTSTLSVNGSTGTAGQVLTSNGASAPTWQANINGITIADDTTTNATRYLTFTSATTGDITTANVASTKLQFNPSNGLFSLGGTSAIKLPVGTVAERPTPAAGMLRFNDDTDVFEGYNGTAWGSIGGGSNITAYGLWENASVISANYTIGTSNNATSSGPITINSGVTVTVPTGSRWVVL